MAGKFTEKQIKKLFCENTDFFAGAVKVNQIPETHFPEIAFAGRSNVGKSSLINAVTAKKIARTSQTPGSTRQVNFFLLDKKLMLADLPGYGFAKAGKKEIEGWNDLIKKYLRGRPSLRRVCLLIDSRHGLKESDIEVMSLLDDSAVSYQIVLTKTDKIKSSDLEKIILSIKEVGSGHAALHPDIIATSAENNTGVDELRTEIAKFVL